MKLFGQIFTLRGGARPELFDTTVSDCLGHVSGRSDHLEPVHCTLEDLKGREEASEILRLVVQTEFAIFDVTGSNPEVLHLLGVRQALSAFPSICVFDGEEAPDIPLAAAACFSLTDEGADRTISEAIYQAAISGANAAPIRKGNVLKSAFRVSLPVSDAPPMNWRVKSEATRPIRTQIGIRPGDIRAVRDFDTWVNSENIYMEMAPVHNPTISGIIRHLGANWRANHGESDDALRRDLAEEMGARRAVDIGTVLFSRVSRSTELYKTHGVKTVAHVATVEPVHPNRPGGGFTATDGLRDCMWNVLEALDQRNRRLAIGSNRSSRVLVPMLGAGTGGADIRSVSQILINATIDYLKATPSCSLERIEFLARTEIDRAANLRAIELNHDLEAVE